MTNIGGDLNNIGNWVQDNPFTIGGTAAGLYLTGGNPMGGVAGAGIGSAIDRSGNPSEHQRFMASTGLNEPGPFQPYTSSPGLAPTSGGGYSGAANFMAPGAGEVAAGNMGNWSPQYTQSAWGSFAPTFYNPTMTEAYTGEALGNMPGAPRTTRYSEDEYLRLRGVDPNLGPAGLDAYYDNAKRRAAESINQQAAARGTYAASTTGDMLNEAFTNLEAERANREADYNLRRAAEERQWEGLRGSAAESADIGGTREAGTTMDWLQGMAGLASSGDAAERQRALDAISTAFGMDQQAAEQFVRELQAGALGQNLAQGRTQTLFEDMMGLGGTVSGIQGQEYEGMLDQDQLLMDKIMEWASGEPALAANQDYRTQESNFRNMEAFYDLGKSEGWF